jgi:hypothetical protein
MNGAASEALCDGIDELKKWIKDNFGHSPDREIGENADAGTPCNTGEIYEMYHESYPALNMEIKESDVGRWLPDVMADNIRLVLTERLTQWYADSIGEYEECTECGKGFLDTDLFYDEQDDGPFCADCCRRSNIAKRGGLLRDYL